MTLHENICGFFFLSTKTVWIDFKLLKGEIKQAYQPSEFLLIFPKLDTGSTFLVSPNIYKFSHFVYPNLVYFSILP